MSDKKDQAEAVEIPPLAQGEANEYIAALTGSNGEGLHGVELDIYRQAQAQIRRRAGAEQELQTWLGQAERVKGEIVMHDHQINALIATLVRAEAKRRAEAAKPLPSDEGNEEKEV